MNEFGSTDPHEVSIPSADITSMEVDRRCHIYINGRELPECETYGWFEAAIHEKAARERLDENGLARCGCGGEVYPHYQLGWCHEESGVQAFEVSTGCDGCGTYTKPRRGHYANGIDEDDTESASKRDWNISHGYTAPPRPGAIGPGTGEIDPSGDEGATHDYN